jgi:acetyl-CoA carboxylase biotin carboxyl carrier protein
MLTYEQIKELIQIVSERRLHELEIERSGFRLKITGAAPAGAPVENRVTPSALSYDPPPAATAPGAPGASGAPGSGGSTGEGGAGSARTAAEAAGHLIASPIVGTFYSSPSPTADPFVRVGDRVRKGQVLCIVEAMKLMNEIECDVDGIVVEIHPQNAQPVEFGEPLFGIRPE